MLSYLVHVIHAFLPVALVTGLLLALWRPERGPAARRLLAGALALGLAAGVLVYLVALRQETVNATRAALFGAALLAAFANAAGLALSGLPSRALALVRWGSALCFAAVLGAVSAVAFLGFVAEQSLSATAVLNTELILNLGGILCGLTLAAVVVPVTWHLAERNRPRLVAIILVLASLLLALPWSAECLLGLMKLEVVELTSLRLSWVARIGKKAHLVPYLMLALLALLARVAYLKRPAVAPAVLQGMQPAERRKAQSGVRLELGWLKGTLCLVLVIVGLSLYYDCYASRPPRITPPTRIAADAEGMIRIGVDQVKDGKLHRYAMVTGDGHVVRFFLIDRSRGQGRIGVVFDACMLCGDMGYLQVNNEVVCIACNVRMFLPSIGKAGGCNPIPLPHSIVGNQVVIAAAELDKGARYFSEVVGITVKDPVTGRELNSLKAPQRCEFGGRTYFFEGEESARKFKANPEKYVGKQQSRYYRVQGFRES
jgi:uncharacterized membrane protein/YHS domain-containing protein